ncbi:MAG: serine/threonine protein kinase [Hydrococcus sp. C42_A2020_068]|uniref:serine/threonine-protein kinase n=1 Tax=Pleurocapsa sp. PCC 7327 TaxID=118163 RepID=UPI00029FCF75|nr:serine/threonine protein kinase [Pleurocapsa sp. PCC 7327]MBF2019422.1 serine/threonine protein kinase [Hydrococcus sp. C42_A2020_068]
MEILCTRPGCPRPKNLFADLDDPSTLKSVQQKYCTSCGMPLILGGHYIPVRLLGQGGFGAAYLARDRFSPTLRSCVVKQFQPSGNLNQQQLEIAQNLFEREAIVLENLGNRHEQIPDLYAFFPLIALNRSSGQQDRFFYLVQEFIDGQTLEEELTAQGQFSEAQIRHLLIEMLKVLKFVHENGSIHRDIKPSNIMRDRNGRLYLLDFGAVKQQAIGSTPSGKSTGIYSMGFAPPEQMAGSQVYPSTDLYALATTCLNLLTGKKPEELYDSYHHGWNWRTHAPQVSDSLAAILDRMLLPTPKDRFQSAQDVLNALDRPSLVQAGSRQGKPTPANLPPAALSTRKPFSLLEVLGSAAFMGFEGALSYIAFTSLLPFPGIALGLWGMCLGGLIYTLYRRGIEGKDLPILAVLTFLLMSIPALRGGLAISVVAIIAVLGGATAIAITAIFRLIYLILSRFF